MKTRIFILAIGYFIVSINLSAQISSDKTSFKFDNTPVITIENIVFTDENKDNMAGIGEKCFLNFSVKNSGRSVAESVTLFVNTANSVQSFFLYQESLKIGNISIGESKDIKIPIVASSGIEDAKVAFQIIAREANKYDSKPVVYTVSIKSNVSSVSSNSSSSSNTVSWYYPYTTDTKVYTNNYTLKACINTSASISELKLEINNKTYSSDLASKLTRIQNCDNYLELPVELEKGDNLVKLVVKSGKSNIESDVCNIIFQEGNPEKRIALIIGNSSYPSAPLKNPVNDANLMSKELTKLGFEVNTILNGSQNQIKEAISQYGDLLSKDKNTVGLFYYAGHGVQIKGKNYLVPTDAKIEKEPDVEVYCVDLDGLLANLEYSGNNMNIIILDACRNNPFGRSFRSGAGPGLATVNAPVGTIIAYRRVCKGYGCTKYQNRRCI